MQREIEGAGENRNWILHLLRKDRSKIHAARCGSHRSHIFLLTVAVELNKPLLDKLSWSINSPLIVNFRLLKEQLKDKFMK